MRVESAGDQFVIYKGSFAWTRKYLSFIAISRSRAKLSWTQFISKAWKFETREEAEEKLREIARQK